MPISPGPRGGKPTVEGAASIPLRAHAIVTAAGAQADGVIVMTGNALGEPFVINLHVVTSKLGGSVLISAAPFRHGLTDRRTLEQVAALTATVLPGGGRRWWWRCPITGVRTGVLYLPAGADRFASRRAHGLDYASQHRTSVSSEFRRLARQWGAFAPRPGKDRNGRHV